MNKKTIIFLLSAIIFVGVIVRLPKFFSIIPDGGVIGPKITWYDEEMSVYFSSQNLSRTIALSGLDTTPCLFFIILHFWLQIVGTASITLISLLPFIFSVASIAGIYLLGRAMGDEYVGLFAAGLFSISPLNIQYATEIRAYSMLVFLIIFFLFFLFRTLSRGEKGDYAGLAIFSLLAMYTHYSALAIIIPAFIVLFFFKKIEWKKNLACVFAAIIGYIPALMLFQRWNEFIGGDAMQSFYERYFSHGSIFSFLQYLYLVVFGSTGIIDLPIVLSPFLAVLLFFYWTKKNELRDRLLAICLIGGWLVLAALKIIYSERYYVIFTIPAILMLAVFVRGINRKYWFSASAAFGIALFLFILPGYFVNNNFAFKYYAPSFAQIIINQARPGDIIIANHSSQLLWARYLKDGPEVKLFFPFNNKLTDDWEKRWRYSDYSIVTGENVRLIDELTRGAKRFWILTYGPNPQSSVEDPKGYIKKYIDAQYTLKSRYFFPPEVGPAGTQAELFLFSVE